MNPEVWSLLCQPLTAGEEEVIAQKRRGATLEAIGATLGVSRSRAWRLVKAAERKIERQRALMDLDDPLDCPIDLLPIPGYCRWGLLKKGGCTTLRDVVHLTDAQLLRIQGVGALTLTLLRALHRATRFT